MEAVLYTIFLVLPQVVLTMKRRMRCRISREADQRRSNLEWIKPQDSSKGFLCSGKGLEQGRQEILRVMP